MTKKTKIPPQLTLLQKLEQRARRRELEKFSKKSYQWFKTTALGIGQQRARDELIKGQTERNMNLKRGPGIGFMYSFVYDAKHKDTLPYWDAFPLIIMVGPADGGFYGINLHYLPPKARALLFDKLLDVASDTRYNNKTKLGISYKLLKSTARYSAFKPCFKHYLAERLASDLVKIGADEWEAALFLPTANFKGASNSKVWSDSISKTR